MRRLSFALALAGLLVAGRAAEAQDVGLEVGSRPAPVTIEDLDGRPVDLGAVIGKKPVLLEFWATWCPLCAELMPRIRAANQKYGDRMEVLLIAVAVNQTKRSLRRHAEKHELPGRLLWDTDGRATRAFNAPTTSYIVVLDRAGRVVYTGVGSDQDIDAAVARALARA